MNGRIDYRLIIDETREKLTQHDEWRKRYVDHAANILENLCYIRSARQEFKLTSALSAYINVTNARAANHQEVNFTLKYLGQAIAKLTVRNGSITIDTSGFDSNNERDFGCKITLSKAPWRSSEADSFRSFFHKREPEREGYEERRLENLLLAEFSKGTEKALPNIQPVKIEGLRFQMPTPLKASNHHKIEYAKPPKYRGGHIDILTRLGRGGRATYPGIIELKDENAKSEPASDVIKQALIYTTFIRELLRSEAGENWWKLFKFSSDLKTKKLVLYSICAMPFIDGADTSFGGAEYDVEGDKIQLHYIYFKEKDNSIEKICTSIK